MNDLPQQLNTEEEIIYEIVDDIINTENKISEMTNSILINDNSNINQTQFNLKHQILKNISQINSLNSELENKKNELIIFQKTNQKELKTIEIQIQEIKSKIKNIPTSNSKEDLYRLNYEKIEEFIIKKKNEDNLKQNYYEFSNYNSQLQNLQTNLFSLQMQSEQIQERINLLNEEILSTEDNIINLLSQKESIEELCNLLFKIRSQHKNNHNILDNSNNNNLFSTVSKYNITTTFANQSELRNIELYHYEICQCDIAKISKHISDIIINYINDSATTIQTNTNNILMYEDNNNVSINMIKLPTKNPLLKGQIISLIRTSLSNFITLKSKLITSYKISNYLSNLSNKIILLVPNSSLTQTKICDLLKYMLKIDYFDYIIKQEMNFIDKDYKHTKKHLMKLSDDINNQIQQIKNRIDDYNIKINSLKQKEEYLIQSKSKDNPYLSSEEQEYIILNENLNDLINSKNSLLNQNEFKEDNLKNEIVSLQNQINDLMSINKSNEDKLEQLNQEIQIHKGNINEQILALRKNIAEKFKLIKRQLAIFKQKHGDNNMDLYNKLTERINHTLRSTSKNLLNLNYIPTNNNITPTSTSNHSTNRNYNNSFLLNNSVNVQDNESISNHTKNSNSNNINNNVNHLLLSANSNLNKIKQQCNANNSNNKNNRQHHSSNSSGPCKSNFKINSIVLSQSASMSRLNNNDNKGGGNTSYNFVNLYDDNSNNNNNTSQNSHNYQANNHNTNKNNLSNIHLLQNKNPSNKSATNYFNRTFKQHISQPIVLKSRNFENLNGNNHNKVNNIKKNIGFNYEQVNKSASSQYKLQNNSSIKEKNSDKNNNMNNNNLNSSRSNNSLNQSNSSSLLRQPHGVFHSKIKHNNNVNVLIKDLKSNNNANNIANYRKLFAKTKYISKI